MGFGAKTVSALVKDVTDDAAMTVLDVNNNASIRMKSTEALQALADPLKVHKNVKRVVLTECEVVDSGCEVLAEILKANHTIEELILDKNKISSVGAKLLADALIVNKGLRTLNLMQQATDNFGEETLEQFVKVFHDNITLTKIMWRMQSRKAFSLEKLQTRNVEIQKRKEKGEDYNAYLPDHMRTPTAAEEAAALEAGATPPAEPAPAAADAVPPTET